MSPEFVGGLISGALATLLGFAFTMVWDVWKGMREESKRSKAILRALKTEFEVNLDISAVNTELLDSELKLLGEGKHLIPALVPFKHGFWDLLKSNIPDKVLHDTESLTKFREVALVVSRLNEGIRSRQTYKDTSGAMGNFNARLKSSDALLISGVKQLTEVTKAALERLHTIEKAV
jgi:hypothetical protein